MSLRLLLLRFGVVGRVHENKIERDQDRQQSEKSSEYETEVMEGDTDREGILDDCAIASASIGIAGPYSDSSLLVSSVEALQYVQFMVAMVLEES